MKESGCVFTFPYLKRISGLLEFAYGYLNQSLKCITSDICAENRFLGRFQL